jgi:hypothetical protein
MSGGIGGGSDKRGVRRLELLALLLSSAPDRRWRVSDAAAELRALFEPFIRKLEAEGIRGIGGTKELRPASGVSMISPPLILLSRQ